MAKPYPEIAALNDRMFREGLKTMAVLERARVSRSTWWRMKKGGDASLSVIHRIAAAIDSLINEKEQTDGSQGRL